MHYAIEEAYKNGLNAGVKSVFVGGAKRIDVNERKFYIELDGIHLIFEDEKIAGWYRPSL